MANARPWDPRLVGAAGLIMMAVAMMAAFVPARRAAAVDPIVVLRSD